MSEPSKRDPVRVLLVGAGHMGASHGRALAALHGFDLTGVVTRGPSGASLAKSLGGVAHRHDYHQALRELDPDAVVIASFTETHAEFAHAALESDRHVFVEKPLADNLQDAIALAQKAKDRSRAIVVGYILRHHPSWIRLVEIGRTLGKPLVMRMNLNQQSSDSEWATHRAIMKTTSPLVDCGVHYVDIMRQLTGARPTAVHGIAARLTDEVDPATHNYGHLQVCFDDGSIGWYEAGWGPMISETAFFVKDVIGPKGSVSIVARNSNSSEIDTHVAVETLLHHRSELGTDGRFVHADRLIETPDEPDHNELCRREQAWFLRAIHGEVNTAEHVEDAIESLRVVLAAEESIRTRRAVTLPRDLEHSTQQ